MDPNQFDSASPGRLIPVSIGGHDWAFVPQPLPRQWDIASGLWPELVRAREELARLDGIGRTLPDPGLLLRPLNNRDAIRSSSLEGTYASPQELLLFELEDARPATASDRANEWREVLNHADALRRGADLLEKLPLSLRVIREIHSVLLTGVRGRERAPGEFRRVQVHVGADKRYVPPPVNELDACLNDFEHFLNDAGAIDPLVRTFLAHYQFESIHPFVDGNGRVGRSLLSLCAFQWCGLTRPWLYLSPFYDRHKDEYIDRMFAVSTRGAWTEWLQFCLRGTVDVCRDAIARCDELLRIRSVYHRDFDRAQARMHGVIEMLFSNPYVRVGDLQKRFGVTYPTAKSDIERLVKGGVLRELAGVYPKAFVAPDVFAPAYDDDWKP